MRRYAGLLLCVLTGCGGPAYLNRPLERYDPAAGYRFDALDTGDGNTDDLFVCLTFSGGGMRAAAMAYGILQELRNTPIGGPAVRGRPHRMLDEVDVISSVSGGSFTAAAYGLWGDDCFDGRFEQRILKRNIQRDLIFRIFTPINMLLLPYIFLDRVDIAADYFRDELFEHNYYSDLVRRHRRPLIVINATNVTTGQRFEFTQDDFDMLGSDLGSVPIGYAVAASSAVPLVLSPMRMRYYPGNASDTVIKQLLTAASNPPVSSGRRAWAKSLIPATQPGELPAYTIEKSAHRFLYLLDGALSDNLGLTYVIGAYREGIIRKRFSGPTDEHTIPPARAAGAASGCDPHMARAASRARRLVVIVVNSGNKPPESTEALDSAPGLFQTGYKAAMISIDNHSRAIMDAVNLELIEFADKSRKDYDTYCAAMQERCPGTTLPPPDRLDVTHYVIEINLANVPDSADRHRCLAIPTSLALPSDQVDLLMKTTRSLLHTHPRYRELLHDLDPSNESRQAVSPRP